MGKKEGSEMSFAGFMSSLAQCEQTEGLAMAKGESRKFLRPYNSKNGTRQKAQVILNREKNRDNSFPKTDKESYSLVLTVKKKRGKSAANGWSYWISGKEKNMEDIKTAK